MFNKMMAAGVAALALTGAANASGLSDGTFAEGATAGSFSTIGTGGSIGTDWSVTGGSIDLIGSYWQAPPAGGYSVDLNGLTAGTISQSFSLAAGEYTLSFYVSGNPDGGNGEKSVLVTAGSTSELVKFDNTGATGKNNMGWTLETLTFTTAGSTTLTFASQTGVGSTYSPYGIALGGISVSAVPEPATLGLLLAGLGMLGVMASRRRVR